MTDNKKVDQLKINTNEPQEFLTTSTGTFISDNQNTLKAGDRGPALLEDFVFREKITHFDHERIPERVVHARGSGAHGFFQVYEPLTDLTAAKFLQDPSLKTPVFVRFSTVVGFRGSADTVRDVRGFATKFYTNEGNFDLVGNNMPVFFIQDAIKFPDVVHAIKPEPHNEMPQASSAHDNFWDFISLTPESMHMIMWLMSDRALPRSYRTMEGFGVHTFRLVNEQGMSRFVKFHWKPISGVYSLLWDETQIIAGKDPDFNRRDLWDSIERGNFPEFELGIQILEENEIDTIEFDILDATKIWPEEDIPVRKIGKMTLNQNPDNFFTQTEQIAYDPGHIVPGIDFSDDPLLQGRLFSYPDTQLTRLGGPNFQEIPINRPFRASNNQRDGFMRQTINSGSINYEPNSLGGGCPFQAGLKGFVSFSEMVRGKKLRQKPESFSDHYSQASLFWNSMSKPEKFHIVKAFHFELGKVEHKHIREKIVWHLNHINHELAALVAKGVGVNIPDHFEGREMVKKSAALSVENHKAFSIAGKKIAIFSGKEGSFSTINELKTLFEQEGAIIDLIGKTLMQEAGIGKTFLTTSSVLYDAVFVSDGLHLTSQDAIRFIWEAHKHCKPIGLMGEAVQLLERLPMKKNPSLDTYSNKIIEEQGVFMIGSQASISSFFAFFKEALGQGRFYEREDHELLSL